MGRIRHGQGRRRLQRCSGKGQGWCWRWQYSHVTVSGVRGGYLKKHRPKAISNIDKNGWRYVLKGLKRVELQSSACASSISSAPCLWLGYQLDRRFRKHRLRTAATS